MSALERLLASAVLLIALLLAGWLGIKHYGVEQYEAGRNAAIAASKVQHDRDAEAAQKTESDLRKQLATLDDEAQQKEQTYAANLEAAQRRVRAGTDRLRCPAVSPVQSAAAPGDRPAAATAATDGAGPDLMPEAASDVLGYGAAIAGLVSRYDEVVERYDACRAVNAKP